MTRALYGNAPLPHALLRKKFCDRHGWKPHEFDTADLCDVNEWLLLDDMEDHYAAAQEHKRQEQEARALRRMRGF